MKKNGSSRNIKYFLAELMILIIGISVSFVLNEYRQQKKEERQEVQLLKSFKANLINDSTILSAGSELMSKQIESARRLILLPNDAPFKDSTALDVVTLLSYLPFNPEDITYQEMKSLGTTYIIQNDGLSKEIIGLYERSYENIHEWTSIDSDHVKNKLIKFTIDRFPFAPNLNFAVLRPAKQRELMSLIRTDEFRHLVQWGMLYKASTKAQFDAGIASIESIIKKIDAEIAPN
ncbi:hypothetical protein BFP97_11805 [Roseivirga sp. 4D4]|uniref:hypothetical protein n=1 Tax=Roseivirga sp. 4D4 TaxID=1889784 RepID=UPI000853447F|nr:hypothetical protein [Roseivirga sp. 4D4]OEK02164.1 hypothetical protein BFP97_11805 [Roseivirga sp. 4D4]